jgi:hypothetical protein
MTAFSIDTNAAQTALNTVAAELQARFMAEYGERYDLEELQVALMRWLELSVEALVEDALFHTVEGDRAYAFNRRAFEMQLHKMQPVESLPHPPLVQAA